MGSLIDILGTSTARRRPGWSQRSPRPEGTRASAIRHARPTHRSTPTRARRALAALTAIGLASIGVLSSFAAQAATVSGNALAGASGFTTVSLGDTVVAGHEMEGSMAIGGDLVVAADYDIVHQVAGNPNYDLPTLDGVPVRLVVGGANDR